MSHAYGILWMTEGPQWVETAPDLESAEEKVQQRLNPNPRPLPDIQSDDSGEVLIEPES
jgi:hypothetical protein